MIGYFDYKHMPTFVVSCDRQAEFLDVLKEHKVAWFRKRKIKKRHKYSLFECPFDLCVLLGRVDYSCSAWVLDNKNKYVRAETFCKQHPCARNLVGCDGWLDSCSFTMRGGAPLSLPDEEKVLEKLERQPFFISPALFSSLRSHFRRWCEGFSNVACDNLILAFVYHLYEKRVAISETTNLDEVIQVHLLHDYKYAGTLFRLER